MKVHLHRGFFHNKININERLYYFIKYVNFIFINERFAWQNFGNL